jgi:hypothetical protein
MTAAAAAAVFTRVTSSKCAAAAVLTDATMRV